MVTAVSAREFYVDPSVASGDGTIERPFADLRQAFTAGAVKPGDTLHLAPGDYGHLQISGIHFDSPVMIVGPERGRAHFEEIDIRSSSNLVLAGLAVWPSKPRGDNGSLVRTDAASSRIEFREFDVRSTARAGSYQSWPKSTWFKYRVSGFLLNGPRNVVRDSVITGIAFGIATTGDHSQILRNQVYGFSGDGLRGLGNGTKIVGNLVQDCVKIDANHDDGIQSWTVGTDRKPGGGVQDGLYVAGNRILEWTGPANHPLRCQLQGMLFGHMLTNLVIINNVVSVSAWHGISAAGIRGGLIANNTLVNSLGPNPKAPWIGVLGGGPTASRNVIVANNIAPFYQVPRNMPYRNRQYRNVVAANPAGILVNAPRGDFRLLPGSGLIDAANPRFAPSTDVYGTTRPLGRGPDIGAVETQ